jgi:hypothetical protein
MGEATGRGRPGTRGFGTRPGRPPGRGCGRRCNTDVPVETRRARGNKNSASEASVVAEDVDEAVEYAQIGRADDVNWGQFAAEHDLNGATSHAAGPSGPLAPPE